jgi:hypothetical protein
MGAEGLLDCCNQARPGSREPETGQRAAGRHRSHRAAIETRLPVGARALEVVGLPNMGKRAPREAESLRPPDPRSPLRLAHRASPPRASTSDGSVAD